LVGERGRETTMQDRSVRDRGASAVEFALLVTAIAAAVTGAAAIAGGSLGGIFGSALGVVSG
jgi:Flp pilus assembly pilin Flp